MRQLQLQLVEALTATRPTARRSCPKHGSRSRCRQNCRPWAHRKHGKQVCSALSSGRLESSAERLGTDEKMPSESPRPSLWCFWFTCECFNFRSDRASTTTLRCLLHFCRWHFHVLTPNLLRAMSVLVSETASVRCMFRKSPQDALHCLRCWA